MFCRRCGREIAPGERFCTRCGTPASPAAPVASGTEGFPGPSESPMPQRQPQRGVPDPRRDPQRGVPDPRRDPQRDVPNRTGEPYSYGPYEHPEAGPIHRPPDRPLSPPAGRPRKGRLIALVIAGVVLAGGAAGMLLWRPWDPYVKASEEWKVEEDGEISTLRYTYDRGGRLLDYSCVEDGEELESRHYEYDKEGNTTLFEEWESDGDSESLVRTSYTYETINGLTRNTSGESSYTVEYDDLDSEEETGSYGMETVYDDEGLPLKRTDYDEDGSEKYTFERTGDETMSLYDEERSRVGEIELYPSGEYKSWISYDGDGEISYEVYYHENGFIDKTYETEDGERTLTYEGTEEGAILYEYDWALSRRYNGEGVLTEVVEDGDEKWTLHKEEKNRRGLVSKQTFQNGASGPVVTVSYTWERRSKLK